MIIEIDAVDPVDNHGTRLFKTALHIKRRGVLCGVQDASTNLDVGSLGAVTTKSCWVT